MLFNKIHNKGQAQLFQNRYLEYLTKTHPLVIWGMYIPIIAFMLFYSASEINLPPSYIVLIFLSGMLTWSLFEYIIHRYVFHFMAESERAMKIVYIIHGNHHEYPRDKQRLFMPAVPSIIMAAIIFSLLYFLSYLFGATQIAFPFFPGFVFGYPGNALCCYE